MSSIVSVSVSEQIGKALVKHAKLAREAILVDPEYRTKEQSDSLGEFNYNGSQSLSELDFKGLDLRNINLSLVKLNKANLSYTNLEYAQLFHTHLDDAILIEANLSKSSLQFTYLNNANLEMANLSNARIRQVNLQNADLSFADLSFAVISEPEYLILQLAKAKSIAGAVIIGIKGININHDVFEPCIKTPQQLCLALENKEFNGTRLDQKQYENYYNIAERILNHYGKIAIEKNTPETKKIDGVQAGLNALSNFMQKPLVEFLKPIASTRTAESKNTGNTPVERFAGNSIFDPNVIKLVNDFTTIPGIGNIKKYTAKLEQEKAQRQGGII